MKQQVWLLSKGLVASSLLSLLWMESAVAELNQAEVCRLGGLKKVEVELRENNYNLRDAREKDILLPVMDTIYARSSSLAELKFNEGSVIRVNANSFFRFEPGDGRYKLRNYQRASCLGNEFTQTDEVAFLTKAVFIPKKIKAQLEDNEVVLTEIIFVLEEGQALAMVPPNSISTQVETPQSRVDILATETSDSTPGLLSPRQKSSAVMVVHRGNKTEVFALTDGDITVSDLGGKSSRKLQGGEKVDVDDNGVGQVQEFDLQEFYQTQPLASDLGSEGKNPFQEPTPPGVQATVREVRVETLAALRRQQAASRIAFRDDALRGRDRFFENRDDFPRDNDGQTGEPSFDIIDPVVTDGIFVRTGQNTATFTDGLGNVTPIGVDFDDGTITINGNTGISNDAGLSGNNASGTVIDADANATRIEVFGVNGEEPPVGVPFQGTLTTGIAPDR